MIAPRMAADRYRYSANSPCLICGCHSVGQSWGDRASSPRWTHGDKEAVGTAYAPSSRIWFTMWHGMLTEVYYPTVDRPQLRDLQYLITDGEHFLHQETHVIRLSLCYRL